LCFEPVALFDELQFLKSVSSLYLFLYGRFIPHWTRALAVVIVVLPLAARPFRLLTLPDPFSFLLWIGFLILGVGAQIYRYRRVFSPVLFGLVVKNGSNSCAKNT
jgi:hypothetical protein